MNETSSRLNKAQPLDIVYVKIAERMRFALRLNKAHHIHLSIHSNCRTKLTVIKAVNKAGNIGGTMSLVYATRSFKL